LIFQNEPQSEGRKGIVLMEKCRYRNHDDAPKECRLTPGPLSFR
jgi:hypothetical protein